MWTLNGAVANGNLDVGIYTDDGARLVSAGPTAQVGVNTYQVVNIGDITLGPGFYYMAIAMDNIVGTIFQQAFVAANQMPRIGQLKMLNAYVGGAGLVANAVFATCDTTRVPMFGYVPWPRTTL